MGSSPVGPTTQRGVKFQRFHPSLAFCSYLPPPSLFYIVACNALIFNVLQCKSAPCESRVKHSDLQNAPFYIAKRTVLHCKTHHFGMQNAPFYNLRCLEWECKVFEKEIQGGWSGHSRWLNVGFSSRGVGTVEMQSAAFRKEALRFEYGSFVQYLRLPWQWHTVEDVAQGFHTVSLLNTLSSVMRAASFLVSCLLQPARLSVAAPSPRLLYSP